MRRPRFEGRRRWLAPAAALLVFVPKCGLCLLGYAGLGTLLGLGGPELCTVDGRSPSWLAWAFGSVAAAALLGWSLRRFLRRRASG